MARTTIAATEGPRAQTLLETAPNLSHHTPLLTGTLRLRAVPAESRHIRWSEDVIDNEGLGRKKSKCKVPFLLLPARTKPSTPIELFRRAAVVGSICSLLLTTHSRLVCCIYHKTREAGESSSEDDSGSDSSSDSGRESDVDNGRAQMSRKTKRENGRHGSHNDECGHCGGEGSIVGKGGVRKKRRNAYEKAPKGPETKKDKKDFSKF